MRKVYRVGLANQVRDECEVVAGKLPGGFQKGRRARMLLKADLASNHRRRRSSTGNSKPN